MREEGRGVHQERAPRKGNAHRRQHAPQHADRRVVLPDAAGRLALHDRLHALHWPGAAAAVRLSPVLPVAPVPGLLGRTADRPVRAHHHGHPPADGRAGGRPRLHHRRYLPLEKLPRSARPDDLDGELPRRLRAAPHRRLSNNGHPGPLLTFYGSEGTLEYNGGSFTLFHNRPRTASAIPRIPGRRRPRRGSGI